MRVFVSTVCIVAFLLTGVVPAFADQVILKNGDRLTGKVIDSNEEKIRIVTDFAGTITIARSQIEKLIIDEPKIEYRDASTETSQPTEPTEPHQGSTRQFSAGRRKLALMSGWDGAANVGFSLTSGNADTSTFTAGVRAERAGASDKWTTYLNGLVSRNRVGDTNVTTSNAVWGGLRYDRNLTKRLFAFAAYDFERDKPQKLNFRSVAGGGLGYHVIKNEKTAFDLFSGIAWNRTWFAGAANTSSAEFLVGNSLKHQFNDRIKIQQGFTVYPNLSDVGEYRFVFDSTLSADITKRIGWFVTIADRFNSAPLAGVERNDFLFSTGLKWAFGKKK